MNWVSAVYKFAFRRSSSFAIVCFSSAFVFERVLDKGATTIFENVNQGKLWKHIKDDCDDGE